MNSTSIFAFFILSLAIGYTFAYSSYGEVAALMAEKSKYQDSLAQVATIETKKAELLEQFNKMTDEQKAQIDTILPSQFNYVALIAQIDGVAAKYGLSIKGVTSEVVDQPVGDSIAEAVQPPTYRTGIIGFSFDGSYDVYQKFMADLERNMRIMDVKLLKVTVGEKGVFNFLVAFETHWLADANI